MILVGHLSYDGFLSELIQVILTHLARVLESLYTGHVD